MLILLSSPFLILVIVILIVIVVVVTVVTSDYSFTFNHLASHIISLAIQIELKRKLAQLSGNLKYWSSQFAYSRGAVRKCRWLLLTQTGRLEGICKKKIIYLLTTLVPCVLCSMT